jgi:hypothetical protein
MKCSRVNFSRNNNPAKNHSHRLFGARFRPHKLKYRHQAYAKDNHAETNKL